MSAETTFRILLPGTYVVTTEHEIVGEFLELIDCEYVVISDATQEAKLPRDFVVELLRILNGPSYTIHPLRTKHHPTLF